MTTTFCISVNPSAAPSSSAGAYGLLVVAAYMMIQTLNKKGYNAFAFSIPSGKEFVMILGLAAPVYLTSISKVTFFSLLIYVATSTGTQTMAAHQVRIQIYMACTVWGEPLCQTAQSFMPELMYGVNQSLAKVDIAYIPFVERFHIVFSEVLKHDITEGRPKLAAWIEEMNKIDAYTETRADPKEIVDIFRKPFLAQQ